MSTIGNNSYQARVDKKLREINRKRKKQLQKENKKTKSAGPSGLPPVVPVPPVTQVASAVNVSQDFRSKSRLVTPNQMNSTSKNNSMPPLAKAPVIMHQKPAKILDQRSKSHLVMPNIRNQTKKTFAAAVKTPVRPRTQSWSSGFSNSPTFATKANDKRKSPKKKKEKEKLRQAQLEKTPNSAEEMENEAHFGSESPVVHKKLPSNARNVKAVNSIPKKCMKTEKNITDEMKKEFDDNSSSSSIPELIPADDFQEQDNSVSSIMQSNEPGGGTDKKSDHHLLDSENEPGGGTDNKSDHHLLDSENEPGGGADNKSDHDLLDSENEANPFSSDSSSEANSDSLFPHQEEAERNPNLLREKFFKPHVNDSFYQETINEINKPNIESPPPHASFGRNVKREIVLSYVSSRNKPIILVQYNETGRRRQKIGQEKIDFSLGPIYKYRVDNYHIR